MNIKLNAAKKELHKDRLKYGENYTEQNTMLHKLLKEWTTKGTFREEGKKYGYTKDGDMLYSYKNEYYYNEGDKQIYPKENLGKLMQLKLEYNSYEGMHNYISAF